MTENNHISEIEYCFNQYFSRYCSPIIIHDYQYYQRKQLDELMKVENNTKLQFGRSDVMGSIISWEQKSKAKAQTSGKWNKVNIDGFIKGIENKFLHNKIFLNDWGRLTTEYSNQLYARLGTKGYENARKKLGEDPAIYYSEQRFIQLLKNQIARTSMPKSTMDYILKDGFSNWSMASQLTMFLQRGRLSSNTEDEISSLEEEIYKPSKATKVAGAVLGMAVDEAVTAGTGDIKNLGSTTAKSLSKNGIKFGAWTGVNLGIDNLAGSDTHSGEKGFSQICYGDENAYKKYQLSSIKYRKSGTEYISSINDLLRKKIKTAPIRPHVSNDLTRKDRYSLLSQMHGNSVKLMKTIGHSFDKQAIPYNSNTAVPKWMLVKSSKLCRTFATNFYSIAKQMSVSRLESYKLDGKTFTLKEVSQRAYNYAKAASIIDAANYQKSLLRRRNTRQSSIVHHDIKSPSYQGETKFTHHNRTINSVEGKQYTNPYQIQQAYPQSPESQASDINNQSANSKDMQTAVPAMGGWENALQSMGLDDFSTVTKNFGYIFAMLPDILINMFTGKSPNFTIKDNILPLSSIIAGLYFGKNNPLLRMMLIGFGGANLLNNAGHEALRERDASNTFKRNYKVYEKESLNPRISNPVIKGRSMITNIDGKPYIINISDEAIDAYEKGDVPLNTLANRVLEKFDESKGNNILISNNYEKEMKQSEIEERTVALR